MYVHREQSAVYGENPVYMTQMHFMYCAGMGNLGEVLGTGRNILFPRIARPAMGPTIPEIVAGWSWIVKVTGNARKDWRGRDARRHRS